MHNKRFLLDIDTKDEKIITRIIGGCLGQFQKIPTIKQETKNGWHYVTSPFNEQEFINALIYYSLESICEVKKDALLFLEHFAWQFDWR